MAKTVQRVIEVIQVIESRGKYSSDSMLMAGRELVYVLRSQPEKVLEAIRIIKEEEENAKPG